MSAALRVPLLRQLVAAALAQLVLLGALTAAGLGLAGWLAGIGYTVGLAILLAGAARRAGTGALGPADLVTLTRAVLTGGVLALVVNGTAAGSGGMPADGGTVGGYPGGAAATAILVALATAALILDNVDGRVARRTGTASELGARFDMEVDAFLILVLSVHVAGLLGPWVLAIGLMRYAYVAASWTLRWLRAPLPPRHSAKVVAAVQGIVLVAAAADVLPRVLVTVAVAVALALLSWSFGHDVRRLWRARRTPSETEVHRRQWPRRAMTVVAASAVLAALVVPEQVEQLVPEAFLRIPAEAILGAGLLLVLPPRARRVVAAPAGALLAVLLLLRGLDLGFHEVLGRPFDPILDWPLLGNALDYLAGSVGRAGAVWTAVGAGLFALAAVVALTASVLHLGGVIGRHRKGTLRAIALLAAGWLGAAALGAQLVPPVPVASYGAAALAYQEARQIPASLLDGRAFAEQAAVDAFRDAPDLLAALRGKDVVLTYVESYGRSAVEDPRYAPRVGAVLDAGTARLAAAGYGARTGFLTSPVTGGGSWLAHATLLSGLRIDNQQRFRTLVASDRLTLPSVFRRSGWETVALMPATWGAWPEGTFYGFDRAYGHDDLGYRGLNFGWSPMPDQYALAMFERLEHGRADRGPLMAEIPLTSSHIPWTPIPGLVGWDDVGDGSAYTDTVLHADPEDVVWEDPDRVRAGYGASIEYSLNTLVSYVETYGDDNLVLIMLGDHQAGPVIVGDGAGHDVPISIVTRDRALLDRTNGWGWNDGLHPGPNAPVWPMEAFRDRFLTAFGP